MIVFHNLQHSLSCSHFRLTLMYHYRGCIFDDEGLLGLGLGLMFMPVFVFVLVFVNAKPFPYSVLGMSVCEDECG